MTSPSPIRALALGLLLIVTLGVFRTSPATGESSREKQGPAARFEALAADYVDHFLKTNPTLATRRGAHLYDDRLEDLSETGAASVVEANRLFAKDLRKLGEGGLRPEQKLDRELLSAHMEAEALETEAMRTWERDAGAYGRLALESVFGILARGTAADAQRMRCVIARERHIVDLLDQGRSQLRKPGKERTEAARREMPVIQGWFRREVAAAFSSVQDKRQVLEFRQAHGQLLAALERWEAFLQEDLPARPSPDAGMGKVALRRWLATRHEITSPLDQVQRALAADLKNTQRAVQDLAAQVRPGGGVADALAILQADRLDSRVVEKAALAEVARVGEFLNKNGLAEVPSTLRIGTGRMPAVLEDPLTAWMDAPGPFETRGLEGILRLAQPLDARAGVGASKADLTVVAMREAFPGRFMQEWATRQAPTLVRRVLRCPSTCEGWAAFAPSWMLEQGFDAQDARVRFAVQAERARTLALGLVTLGLHAGTMDVDGARRLLILEAWQGEEAARDQALAGLRDPEQAAAALGLVALTKLSADLGKKRGSSFRPRELADAVTRQGYLSLARVRRGLIPGDARDGF